VSEWQRAIEATKKRSRGARLIVTVDYSDAEPELRPWNLTFNTEVGQFKDNDIEERIESIMLQSLMPKLPAQFLDDDIDDEALVAATEQSESNKRKWLMDNNIVVHPAVEHRERFTWMPLLFVSQFTLNSLRGNPLI